MTEEDDRRRRREEHRWIWLELTFDPVPDDWPIAVVGLWAAGETSARVAAEILDVAEARLTELAERSPSRRRFISALISARRASISASSTAGRLRWLQSIPDDPRRQRACA